MFKMNNVQLRNPGGGSAVAAPRASTTEAKKNFYYTRGG